LRFSPLKGDPLRLKKVPVLEGVVSGNKVQVVYPASVIPPKSATGRGNSSKGVSSSWSDLGGTDELPFGKPNRTPIRPDDKAEQQQPFTLPPTTLTDRRYTFGNFHPLW
jgi:hypothetical protein